MPSVGGSLEFNRISHIDKKQAGMEFQSLASNERNPPNVKLKDGDQHSCELVRLPSVPAGYEEN